MSQILQGAGGTPVLDEDMLEKMRASGKAYAVEGADPRIIQAGSIGNATIPMAQYITSTGTPVALGYTYEPYIPEDKIGDIIAKQKEEEAEGDADDYSDLVTPSGTPIPGHPDYEAYMIAGGEGLPDHAGSTMADHNGYVGNTFVGIGNALTSAGKVIPGFIGTGLHSIGQGMIGHDETDISGVPTYTTAGSFAPGAFSTDGVATSAHGTAGPSSIGTNQFGDTVSVGYGAGQIDPSMAGAAGFSGGDAGTGGSSSNNAPSVDLSQGSPAFNYGGKVNSYGHGGPVAEQEDPYVVMPVAKPAPMAPLQGALKANQINSQYQKPWYQQMGQAAGTSVMSNVLMKGIGMMIPGLGFNKGGKVCPCGTPGCPGCGKGYNYGGPISASGYKQKIAMAESAAKIKREDMKAYADVYKKMKGPLQGE